MELELFRGRGRGENEIARAQNTLYVCVFICKRAMEKAFMNVEQCWIIFVF